ncbi:hypothetical protein [Microbacterium sp.]|uniref:hypothetical protein n=1 Tax=Microbacterium sp. TaxID=51671 RepID=UPI002812602D|nr:hypothetical protein [Microbacterium sp.]
MAEISSERRALLEGVAGEFLHEYPRGARLLAVAGADAGRAADFARDLASVLAERGLATSSVAQDGRGEHELRAEVAAPVRAERADAVTIVSGDGSLLADRTRGLWHSSVCVVAGDEEANTLASAIVDATDPDRPIRRLADYCQCDIE